MSTVGSYRHLVLFQNPGPPIPDGDGGYTQTWSDAVPPSWHVSIEPATARDLERVSAGTVSSDATHIIKGRYHPQVTTKSRIVFNGRTMSITGVANIAERKIDMELIAVEPVI